MRVGITVSNKLKPVLPESPSKRPDMVFLTAAGGGKTNISTGQRAMRKIKQNTCKHHPLKNVELLCEVCIDFACIECVPTLHYGHRFVSLRDIKLLRSKEIRHFMDISEDQKLAEIQQRIASTLDRFKEDEDGCDDLESYLRKGGSDLKCVDILTVRRGLAEYPKATNMEMRQIYKWKLVMVPGDVQEYKALLLGGPDDVHISDKVVSQTLTEYHISGCAPQKLKKEHIARGLSVSNTEKSLRQCPLERIDSPSKQFNPNFCLPAVPPSQYKVLQETNVLRKFRSPRKISQICPTGDMAWALFNNKITLLDKTGKIQQQRIYNLPIKAILLQASTRQLHTFDDNGIIDLSTGARIMYFPPFTEPTCLYFCRDGCILIGIPGKIAKFARDGTQILTTTAAYRTFVFTPTKMTECPLTGNIAFVDLDLPKDGGQGDRHVQVMNKGFQEDIRLRVETYISDVKTSGTNRKGTCDIEYDRGGNLVLVDGRTVFLIDMKTEDVLRTLHTDKHPVVSLGLGSQGELWITLRGRSNKVKVLEYIESF